MNNLENHNMLSINTGAKQQERIEMQSSISRVTQEPNLRFRILFPLIERGTKDILFMRWTEVFLSEEIVIKAMEFLDEIDENKVQSFYARCSVKSRDSITINHKAADNTNPVFNVQISKAHTSKGKRPFIARTTINMATVKALSDFFDNWLVSIGNVVNEEDQVEEMAEAARSRAEQEAAVEIVHSNNSQTA